MLRRSLPLSRLRPLLLAAGVVGSSSAVADSALVGWTFDDDDLIADQALEANAGAAITTSGSEGFVNRSSGRAASFSDVHEVGQSYVEIPFDASGHESIRLSFVSRTSNTASKYWKVQLSAGAEQPFVDVGPVLAHEGITEIATELPLPAANGMSGVRVRFVPTDSNGDGTGTIAQADGSEDAPSNQGTFRLDDVFVYGTPPGGVPDAGAPDAGPPPPFVYEGLAVTEIYFNPPTSAETGKEWVEIANLSGAPIALDGAVVERLDGVTDPSVERTATIAGTGIVLEPGDRVVLAQTLDLDVGVCVGGPFVVLSSSELQLANSGTQWIRVTASGVTNTVKYAGSGVSVPEGYALALLDEELDNSDPASFGAADCEYAPGAFGSPGVRNEDCAEGAVAECVEVPDAGPPPVDGGEEPPPPPPPDAGPNAAPAIRVSAPAGPVSSEGSVDITYSASDPDPDDAVEVSLFYDLDGQNQDGVRIASGLPGGEGRTYTWSTSGVPPGTYHVFASVRDLRGETRYAYADGTVVVGGGVENDIATIALVEPDGVNDTLPSGEVLIRWEIAMPEGAVGNVSLYYDTDEEGLDGKPIIAGIPFDTESGEEGLRTFLWDPSDVEPGSYTIYAVLDWTRGRASAYSAAYVNLGAAAGCGCRSSAAGAPLEAGLVGLLLLGGAALRRRRVSPSGTASPGRTGPNGDET